MREVLSVYHLHFRNADPVESKFSNSPTLIKGIGDCAWRRTKAQRNGKQSLIARGRILQDQGGEMVHLLVFFPCPEDAALFTDERG